MLQINNLNAGYGRIHVLYDVSIQGNANEIVGIVGPNGSGKTTLLNSCFNLADIFSGSVKFDGEEIVGLPPHKIAEKGLAYCMQMTNIFPGLTVEENLKVAASLKAENASSKIKEVLELLPVLKPFLGRRANTLSGGERQMLGLAMVLIKEPKMLLLDEPTTGLSPLYSNRILSKVYELNQTYRIGIFIVEQNVMKLLKIVNKIYLLVSGKVVFEGAPSEMLKEKDLLKLYLGVKAS